MDRATKDRLSQIRMFAERVRATCDPSDAFTLAKLVLEGLNKEETAHASEDISESPILAGIYDRLAKLEESAVVHRVMAMDLQAIAAEFRREDVGNRLAKLEFRAENADCHAKKMAEVRALWKEVMEEAKAAEVDPLDRNPDEGERWKSPWGVVYWIDGDCWNDGFSSHGCTRRQLIAKGWERVGESPKDRP